jgi:ABC-type oligopeptide transport system substrate-binding subunit
MPACLLLIAIAATALPSCGRNSGVSETETPLASPVVLRRGNGGDPQTLDPAKADDVHSFRVLTDLFEGLLTLDASGNVVAGAAENWELSEDGLTYTFQLRQNLVWSNGEELTADHFVAGFQRTLAPEIASTYGFLLHSVRNANEVALGNLPPSSLGVSAPGPQTLVVELDSPTPHFLAVLAMPVAFPFLADPLAATNTFPNPQQFVSNGPFVLDDWMPGHRVRLQKNPLFHDADSVHIDTVEYYAIQDLLSELNMYRAGELDITASVPGANIEELRVSRSSELRVSPSLAIYYLAFDLSEAPFDDIALRQALSLAIDRRALVNVIGRGEQPAYGLVPDGVSAYTPSRYDWQSLGNTERENEARRVFASSPHYGNDSLQLTLTYDVGDIHERVAVAVTSMWRDVLGVDVELDKREWQYFLETRGNRDEWQIMRFTWSGDYNHASTFTGILLSASPQNLPGYQSPRFDDLVAAALAEQDTSTQAQLFASAEAEMLADYPIAPLYFYVSKHLVSPAVRGFEQNVLDQHPSRYMRLSQTLPSKSGR